MIKENYPILKLNVSSKDAENYYNRYKQYEKIESLALNKAKEVLSRVNEDAIIISADTVVVLNNKIISKDILGFYYTKLYKSNNLFSLHPI